jgi:hypothetical protein
MLKKIEAFAAQNKFNRSEAIGFGDKHGESSQRSTLPQEFVIGPATNLGVARWRLQPQAFEKKVHKHSSPEEYLKLAEVCLLEAERTLDREVVEMLLLKAGRYLEDAKRTSLREPARPTSRSQLEPPRPRPPMPCRRRTRTTTRRTQAVDHSRRKFGTWRSLVTDRAAQHWR